MLSGNKLFLLKKKTNYSRWTALKNINFCWKQITLPWINKEDDLKVEKDFEPFKKAKRKFYDTVIILNTLSKINQTENIIQINNYVGVFLRTAQTFLFQNRLL
jgi:hypothetical protein